MSDFQAYSTSHKVNGVDWNYLLDHGLEKPTSVLMRKVGSTYETINGPTGKKLFSNVSFKTVFQGTLDAYPNGIEAYFKQATYVVDATPLIPSKVKLIAEPGTILQSKAGLNDDIIRNTHYPGVTYDEDITIDGFIFDLNGANQTGINAFGTASVFFGGYLRRIRMQNCRIINPYAFNLLFGSGTAHDVKAAEDMTLENVIVDATGQVLSTDVVDVGDAWRATVRKCVFKNQVQPQNCLSLHNLADSLIENVDIIGTDGVGLYGGYLTNTTIRSVRIKNFDYDGLLISNSEFTPAHVSDIVHLDDVTVYNCGSLAHSAVAVTLRNSKNIKLYNSFLYENPGSAIIIKNVEHSDIEHNRFRNNPSTIVPAWHILFDPEATLNSYIRILDNDFQDTRVTKSKYGISLAKEDYVTIKDNNLRDVAAAPATNYPIYQSTGIHNIFLNNPGYNPKGKIATPYSVAAGYLLDVAGAQAFPSNHITYTVGNSPKLITLYGGIVSMILIDGEDCGLTSGSFTLMPGQTFHVDWTGQPSSVVYAL